MVEADSSSFKGKKMSTADIGGPAFPLPLGTANCSEPEQSGGMSLRDYFAGKALNGICASFSDYDAREMMIQNAIAAERDAKEQVAFAAYEYADAMIAERAK